MNFDVVIGNPPYQEDDGNGKGKSSPIYQRFVESAIDLGATNVSMITPSRWFSGGKGLDSFRERMLTEGKISAMVDYPNADNVFTNVAIKGGASYFVYDKNHEGDSLITTVLNNESNTMSRPLLEDGLDFFIRYNDSVNIVRKVISQKHESFSTLVSPRKPFGISSTFKEYLSEGGDDRFIIYGNKTKAFVDKEYIFRNIDLVDKFKVFISFAYGAGDNYPHQIINKPFIGEKGSTSTETYLAIGSFDTELEANNCMSYIKSKFFRFMVLQKKISQNATRLVYELVPLLDFSSNDDIDWSQSVSDIDNQLYDKFDISNDEISFINKMIKEME